ncbi:alkane 1-monooxygenase [Chitinimonas sp. BJYL2]|uniref:alkane 1-monooxygenase n=1 Tax=Chitinimonas sp. BJYL2 TaxID=2976696 RepID=UPI0022B4B7D8|nr:alkane 1-monooxygenase [Chitinimonas sp. BJYL2]
MHNAPTIYWRILKHIGFVLALLGPLHAVGGFFVGGYHAWHLLVVAFVISPLIDVALGEDPTPPGQEGLARRHLWFDGLLLVYVLAYWTALVLGLIQSAQGDWSWADRVGATLSMGVVGGIGIVVAHELGHRKTRTERLFAQLLLQPVCYGHFTLEHNRGHHAWVATPGDPASARLGESYYRFWWRSVRGTWLSAWRLEFERMQRLQVSPWSWRNAMWRHTGIPVLIAAAVTVWLGPWALLFWLGQAVMAFSLLEVVNYLEHYGLQRRETGPDRYEPVRPVHSWNSNRLFSNLFLYQLQRHSDHHTRPAQPYQALQPCPDAPQLPSGYTAMIPLALIPPLWFAVMNPRAERWRQVLENA